MKNNLSFTIRRAEEKDRGEIAKLILNAWREGGKPSNPRNAEVVGNFFKHFFVAMHDNKVVGMIALWPRFQYKYLNLNGKSETSIGAGIESGYVLPNYRERGIYTKLFETALIEASSNPKIIFVYAIAEGSNVPEFLKKRDFEKIGLECMNCPHYPVHCHGIPIYRKKIR